MRDALLKVFSDYGKIRYTCGMFVAKLIRSIEKESEIDEIIDVLKNEEVFLGLAGVKPFHCYNLYEMFVEAVYTPSNRRHTICGLAQGEATAPLSEEAIRLWIGRRRSDAE
jgi:hypothetical protein